MSEKYLEPGKLCLATHNKGKLREIREIMAPFGFEVASAAELDLPEPEETGSTFEANAELKALAAAKASGLPSLADDSGFCVEALDGAPGIYSARWAGPDKDFNMAMRRIEEKLQSLGAQTPQQRQSSFVSVLCLTWPNGESRVFRGEVFGTMVWPPRGDQGFGYDPIFLPKGETRTYGEMPSMEKNATSHRAIAFSKFKAACIGKQ